MSVKPSQVVRLLFVGFAVFLTAGAKAEAIAVIANPKFAASSISEDDLRMLYLGKVRELSGVGPVSLLDLPTANNLYDRFAAKVLDKTPKELNAYWSVRIFTGRGTPPQAVSDEKAMKAYVATHPDAIGYIDQANVDSSVKVILRVP